MYRCKFIKLRNEKSQISVISTTLSSNKFHKLKKKRGKEKKGRERRKIATSRDTV